MTSTSWKGGNGDFNNPANWTNGVPGLGVDAIIDGSATAPLTVTYSSGNDVANSLTTTYTTLGMSAGSLTLSFGSSLSSSVTGFSQSGGVLDFQNGESLNQTSSISGTGGAVTQTAGTIEIDQGYLDLYGNSSFSGTLASGPLGNGGTVEFNTNNGIGDTYTLNAGAKITTAGWQINGVGALALLKENFSYAGQMYLDGASTLNIGTFTFTLAPTAVGDFRGLVTGTGTLLDKGVLSLNSISEYFNGYSFHLGGGVILEVASGGITNLFSTVYIGDSSASNASVKIDAGGVFNLLGQTINVGSTNNAISNAGLFENTQGTNNSQVNPYFTNTGTVANTAAGSTITFDGGGSFGGTLSGVGAIDFAGGKTYTIAAGTNYSVAYSGAYAPGTTLDLAASLSYAGNFYLDGPATLGLGSNNFTLTASSTATLLGHVTGSGTILEQGTLSLSAQNEYFAFYEFTLGGSSILEIAAGASTSLSNTITIGDSGGSTAELKIDAGGVLNLQGNQINAGGATNMIVNAGTFDNTLGASNSVINVYVSSTGTVSNAAAGSTISFEAGGNFGGTVSGAGTINFAGGRAYSIAAGTNFSVADAGVYAPGTSLDLAGSLSYAGNFYLDGPATLGLGSNNFTLTASSTGTLLGHVTGSGTLLEQGALSLTGMSEYFAFYEFTLGGSALLEVAAGASTSLSSTITIGDSGASTAQVKVDAGGVLNLQGNSINAGGAADAISNAGLFENTQGTGTSLIYTYFTNTGTVTNTAVGSSITFEGGGTFSGTISGAGGVNFGGGKAYSIASGTIFTVARTGLYDSGTSVTFTGNEAYAGVFTESAGTTLTLATAATKFSLSGTAGFYGLLDGAGQVAITGTGAQLTATGLTIDQSVALQVGAGAVMTAGGVTLGGSAVVEVVSGGTENIVGGMTIGDNGTSTALLKIDAGGVLNIGGDYTIAANGSGAIVNAGLIEKTAGAGSGNGLVYAAVTSTGTIASNVAGNALTFEGGGTFGRTLAGAGTINFAGGHAYLISTGTKLTVASLGIYDNGTNVTFAGSETDAGTFYESAGTTMTLSGASSRVTLTGTAGLHGLLTGSGQVVITGAGANLTTDGLTLGGSVVLADSKALIAQAAQWTIGNGATSSASLQILAHSTYEITGDVGIGSNGTGGITNAGLFEKVTGSGTSVITPLTSNSGTIAAASGTLDFTANFVNTGLAEATTGTLDLAASVTNDGTLSAAGGHELVLGGSLASDAGKVGVVDLTNGGLAQFGGFVGSSETLQFLDTSISEATISQPGNFSASIAGFGGSNKLDLGGIQNVTGSYSGNTTAGVLKLTELINGSTVTVAQLHFTGNYSLASFSIGNDGNGGTLVQDSAGAVAWHAVTPPIGAMPFDVAGHGAPIW